MDPVANQNGMVGDNQNHLKKIGRRLSENPSESALVKRMYRERIKEKKSFFCHVIK